MVAVLQKRFVGDYSRRLMHPAAVTRSPFSPFVQVQDWDGDFWEYGLTLIPVVGTDGAALDAFFNALGGPTTPFLFPDPRAATSISDIVTVEGAGQNGGALATTGWSPLQTVLRTGQFFSLGTGLSTEFYQITADVDSNATGTAILVFTPDLRSVPANGVGVEVANPQVLLRLNEVPPAELPVDRTYRWTVTAREGL